jgi:hypothetical protein
MPKMNPQERAAVKKDKEERAREAAGETGDPIPYQRYTHDFTGWTGAWRVLAENCGWTPLHRSVHIDIFRFGMGIAILFWKADLRVNPDTPDDCLDRAVFLIADRPQLAPFEVLDPHDVEQLIRLHEDLKEQALERDLEAFTAHNRKEYLNEDQSS